MLNAINSRKCYESPGVHNITNDNIKTLSQEFKLGYFIDPSCRFLHFYSLYYQIFDLTNAFRII